MAKHFKIIIYLVPLFICFSLFGLSGICAALPNYEFDTSGLTVIQGGLNDTYEIGLSGPSNLFTIPAWTDNVLDPYLYGTFGWDTEDASGYILEPLDPTEEQFVGRHVWQAILGSNVSADEFYIEQQIENGFRIFGWSPEELGKLATVIGTGARLYWMGKIGEVTDKITDVGQNLLVKLGSNFSQLWSSAKSSLTQNGDIYNTSVPNSVYYSSYFNVSFLDDYYVNQNATLNFSDPVFYYGNNHLYFVFPTSMIDQSNQIRCNGSRSWKRFNSQTNEYDEYYQQFGLITLSGVSSIGTYNGIQYSTGFLYGDNLTWNWFNSLTISSNFSSLQDIKDYLNNNNDLQEASSIDYLDENGQPFDLQSLLDDLNGKYVTTDQLGQIKILIDSNPINADASGAHQIFTDDSLQTLIDLINGIVNEQDNIADELTDNDPDPDPDPNPDPDPEPFTDNTGISVPPDYPTQTFDTVNDIIRSPLEFFSIFEPIFMIFGSSALIIFGLWLFVPCVIIIGFIIWALK